MNRAFRAIWLGIAAAYGELFTIVGMNLLWLIFNIPFAAVGLFVVPVLTGSMNQPEEVRGSATFIYSLMFMIVLVMGPNPLAAGIHLWANRLAKEERVEFGLFWEGLREYWRPALALFALSLIVFVLLNANVYFYLNSESWALQAFGMLWLYGMILWMGMQFYMLPLLVEQDDKRLRMVLRNALFLSIHQIIPTLILLIVCSFLILLSLGLTLLIVLVTASLIALIQAHTVQLMLEQYRARSSEG